MPTHAMYPGSFDPITNGHVDVIERAAAMFDRVTVVVAVNTQKVPMFTEQERLELARRSLEHLPTVSVDLYHGLIVDYARQHGITTIIRGVRAISDFEYEFQMALMNRKLEPSVTTVFMMPHERYTFLNSSIVRELARFGVALEEFVPAPVAEALREKFSQHRNG
ncbi:MAG: pantetheine-phosphate adenylyltransferase [Bacteroidota bacterium]|nr:pantetheine-phosphate adenylyltransferase [Candidatus Kapabacteria bacterium]MCX7937708.1 pantetheine-phosphate adenylyltransferase [Chlorobiota bacterium]MDW8075639.1 pantetheine-phosphate adenylyltransferase [Bacteroidota bacterium]MDW8272297.1 pantetheine-phosphate adenylyltransferase [Bacteroidota bacterium]